MEVKNVIYQFSVTAHEKLQHGTCKMFVFYLLFVEQALITPRTGKKAFLKKNKTVYNINCVIFLEAFLLSTSHV